MGIKSHHAVKPPKTDRRKATIGQHDNGDIKRYAV